MSDKLFDIPVTTIKGEQKTLKDFGGKAVLVEINCETDFVAKDASFLKFHVDRPQAHEALKAAIAAPRHKAMV